MDYPVYPCGDSAFTVKAGDGISEEIHRRVFQLFSALERSQKEGITELVPTYDSVCVHYDPAICSGEEMLRFLRELNLEPSHTPEDEQGRLVRIPVCYGGEYGPDLKNVAEHAGMPEEEVIRIHSGGVYLTFMLGFLPGFAYLGGMDERIACPRLASPRTQIPAGSVGIAGKQTGIYPLSSPGGWQLIGRTPRKLFAFTGENADFLLSAGDRVQFYPITETEFAEMEAER